MIIGKYVKIAFDGKEAIDVFEKHNPDIVLLDVMMPNIDGFEVCREIRKKSNTPIIMITARGEDFENNKVKIIDKGIGIAMEDMPYIFDRYYRVKSDVNKSGTGLGLTIAKQIALRHNINLTVNSEQNIETSFIFDFN